MLALPAVVIGGAAAIMAGTCFANQRYVLGVINLALVAVNVGIICINVRL